MAIFLAHRRSREAWDPTQVHLGRDRRIFVRVPLKVICQMDHQTFNLETHGTLVNLSLGGAGFLAPVNWPEGSRVRLIVESYDFEAPAIIVFRKATSAEYLYGVQFRDTSFRTLFQLRGILRKNHRGSLTV
jgi:c-di-GMP-binding flagellar brake protein YcgR